MAAQMKTRIAIMKAGHQKNPIKQRITPIAIKHPLDSFGLIGCPQCGHFSAAFETSLLQAGQVINPAIFCFTPMFLSLFSLIEGLSLPQPEIL